MQNVTMVRFSPTEGSSDTMAQLIECYRDVFADEPWHEWLRCPTCNKYWGKKDSAALQVAQFQHCGVPLEDFWPREVVRTDFEHEVTAEASCWLALHDSRVIGFCMGYPVKIVDLEEKLGIPFNASLGCESSEIVAYQDDVGLLTPFRGQKLSKTLLLNRHDDFMRQNLKLGVVRTRQFPEPSITFLWYTGKLDYRILARYPGDDGRVILGRELEGLRGLLVS